MQPPTLSYFNIEHRHVCAFSSGDENPVDAHLLFEVPHLEIERWNLIKKQLSALECAKLADCLGRSVRLTSFHLKTANIEDPHVLEESLVNAVHLRDLCFEHFMKTYSGTYTHEMTDILVGEDGNGILRRLLQNPSSQLQRLDLSGMNLNDRQFMALADMVSTSPLKWLAITWFFPSLDGIAKFANQLPRMKCLKKLTIGPFVMSWFCTMAWEYCGPFLAGMKDNISIEKFTCFNSCDSLNNLLQHYTNLNHAGRRILVTTKIVPAGLWPWILERAGRSNYLLPRCTRKEDLDKRRANSIFFFLQNCPAIFCNIIHCQEL